MSILIEKEEEILLWVRKSVWSVFSFTVMGDGLYGLSLK